MANAPQPSLRQPGWVLLIGTLGVACLSAGSILLAMLQAPHVSWPVIATSCTLIAAGAVLLWIAWLRRARMQAVETRSTQLFAPVGGDPMTNLQLSPENNRRLDELSRRTGRTQNELLNDAVNRLVQGQIEDEAAAYKLWRDALLGITGIWKDRDDLPDFDMVRRSLDRDPWSRSVS